MQLICFGKAMSLKVRVSGTVGDCVEVEILDSHSIYEVKEAIAGRCNGHPEYYELEWNGMELQNDDKTARDYGINNGDSIITRDSTFTVIIQGPLPAGEKVSILVNASMTIDHIKKMIAEIFGYNKTSEIDVIMDDKLLLTTDIVRTCGIREGQNSFLSIAEQIPLFAQIYISDEVLQATKTYSPDAIRKDNRKLSYKLSGISCLMNEGKGKSLSSPDLTIETSCSSEKPYVNPRKSTMPVRLLSETVNVFMTENKKPMPLSTIEDTSH